MERAFYHIDPYMAMAPELGRESLQDFLRKPVKVVSGNVPLDNTATFWGLPLTVTNLFSTNPIWAEKFKGFLGIRGSIKVRVEVTVNPFMAGRLRLVHVPCHHDEGNFYDRTSHRTMISQLPGVELDYSDATACEMTIPYINNKPWVNLLTTQGGWGNVYLTNYISPVLASGVLAPYYSVYVSMEDVELCIPTARGWSGITPQMGTRERSKDPEENQSGPISGFLGASSRVVGLLGRKVPFLSSYAVPASWALRMSAKVASAFGYDKPQLTNAPMLSVNRIQPFTQNADGVDVLHNMSLLHDSKVKAAPGFAGSSIDEMAISFLVGVPTMIGAFNFMNQSTDALLYKIHLCPDSMFYCDLRANAPLAANVNATIAPFPNVFMSPVCAISQMFSLFRGGFYIRLKFAKTRYHAGRLMCVYTPGAYNGGIGNAGLQAPSVADSINCQRTIIDLREGNDFTIHCPYKELVPWLPCHTPYGTLCIFAAEPLQYTGEVSPYIRCNVEVYADNEMTFSGARSTLWAPTRNNSNILYQSGSMEMAKSKPIDTISLAEITTGEVVLSMKQLLQRPHWNTGVHEVDIWTEHAVTYTPTNAAPTAVARNGVDHIDYVSSWYALERGGRVFRSFGVDGIQRFYLIPPAYPGRPKAPLYGQPIAFEKNNMLSAYVPRLSTTTSTLIRPNTSLIDWSAYNPSIRLEFRNTTDGANITNYYWTRVLADDAQFGCFLGIPPMVYASAGSLFEV